jgi:hypothetical protein
MLGELGAQIILQLFPMAVKALGMPLCHSLNTIKVYKSVLQKHGTNIMHSAFLINDFVTTFHSTK